MPPSHPVLHDPQNQSSGQKLVCNLFGSDPIEQGRVIRGIEQEGRENEYSETLSSFPFLWVNGAKY